MGPPVVPGGFCCRFDFFYECCDEKTSRCSTLYLLIALYISMYIGCRSRNKGKARQTFPIMLSPSLICPKIPYSDLQLFPITDSYESSHDVCHASKNQFMQLTL